jgi:glutamate/aspartate transport system substrate-binding protein
MPRHKKAAIAARFLSGALVALSFAMPAAAQDSGTLKKIKDTGTITVGHRDASIPFSYYDDQQKPVGYAMDICAAIVDAVKKQLNMPNLKVNYQLVTSANRIPLMANGTIDLECGSTTNNNERQQQVSFTNTHFIPANRWAYKKSSNVATLNDLKGKTIVSTAGTSNIKLITQINSEKNLGMNIVSANGHPEAFQMVETGRAVAFVMDDILLYGLIANSRNPGEFAVSKEFLSLEPYGIMLRKDDPAFQKVADDATAELYKSGRINAIYDKWFLKPIPPKGVNLNVPQSEQMKKIFANPTHTGDPKAYE